MKITPLVTLAALRVPALTSLFSDALNVTSMSVVADGTTTITCAAAHGLSIGAQHGICITDALTPNPITAWTKLANGDVRLTTEYPHDLTGTPDPAVWESWDAFAIISGTTVTGLNGNKQLVTVDSPTVFTVRPGGTVTLPGTVPDTAILLRRLERGVVGWHPATAASATTLTFETPAAVSRSYTVTSPTVVKNIRVWGAVDLEHALSHFTRDNDEDTPVPGQGYLFVCPIPNARLSRDIASKSDAPVEVQPGNVVRQRLMDGFEIYAILPSERSGGAVGCMDKAHGGVLRAIMKTFNGVALPYTEFAFPNPTIAMMTAHGMARYTRANYVHSYTFDTVLYITNEDCAAPIDIPDLSALDSDLTEGVTPDPGSVTPIGSVPFDTVSFAPDPDYGIYQSDKPQPLTCVIHVPPS